MKEIIKVFIFSLFTANVFGQDVQFLVQDIAFNTADTVRAEFRVFGFDSISCYQFALKFDTAVLHLERVVLPSPTAIPMADLDEEFFTDGVDTLYAPGCIQGNFGLCKAVLGEVRHVWSNPYSSTCENGSLIFTLVFTAKANSHLSQSIVVAPYIISSAAYAFPLRSISIGVSFVDNSSQTTSINDPLTTEPIVAYPNPFVEETTITFHLKSPEKVQMVISDSMGKQSFAMLYDGVSGLNSVKLKGLLPGLYFFGMATKSGIRTTKLISR